MAAEIWIRTATPLDAETLAAIERDSFPDPSWIAEDFLRYDCVVAEIGGHIAGFLVSRENFTGPPPERELLNLAVQPGFRRLGIANRLLACEMERGATLFLEVRQSNLAAIHLYKKAGFRELSTRPDYYSNPSESAIVMRLKW